MSTALTMATAQKPIRVVRTDEKRNGLLEQRVKLQKQYVVGRRDYFGVKLRTLSQTIDDATRLSGYKIYEEMLNDPDVSSGYWYLVYSILADELMIRPVITKKDDPNYDLAAEIADFCQHLVMRMEGSVRDILEQMLEFMLYGHKIGEVTYALESWRGGSAKLVIDNISVLPYSATSFFG